MPKPDNHVHPMNNGEGSSTSSKDSNPNDKDVKNTDGSPAKSPIPAKTCFVGREVDVKLSNGKNLRGVCIDPGFGDNVKLRNAYVTPGAGFEPFVYTKNIHHAELEIANADIVDVKTNLGTAKKRFATDGEYSKSHKYNDENLVQWNGGESSEQQLDHASFTRGGGWSVEDMFKTNENLGVRSTFKTDLTQYTTCEPVGSEEDKIRAAKIAREIETNDKSKRLAFLENDDEERDLDKETSVPEVSANEKKVPATPGDPPQVEAETRESYFSDKMMMTNKLFRKGRRT
jgi:hypothetical protein